MTLALLAALGYGPVDHRPYPTRPSPAAEAEIIRRAEEKRARKAGARAARRSP